MTSVNIELPDTATRRCAFPLSPSCETSLIDREVMCCDGGAGQCSKCSATPGTSMTQYVSCASSLAIECSELLCGLQSPRGAAKHSNDRHRPLLRAQAADMSPIDDDQNNLQLSHLIIPFARRDRRYSTHSLALTD